MIPIVMAIVIKIIYVSMFAKLNFSVGYKYELKHIPRTINLHT